MNDSRNDGAGLLLAFLAGAIVGVGVGLLVAPGSGKETRERISDLARQGREKAAEAAANLRRRAHSAGDEIRNKASA